MILFPILGVILLFVNSKRVNNNTIEESLSKTNTNVINGFFVILIFSSHLFDYTQSNSNILYTSYSSFQYLHHQLIVTSFMMFSGYGVFYSLNHKRNYMNSFFKNRILRLWISFAIAIIFYFVLSVFQGNNYSLTRILLSFTGLTSIGNSNWYMFTIFVMYIFTFVSYKLASNKNRISIILIVISAIYTLLIKIIGLDYYFYLTTMLYPLGAFIYEHKEILNKYLTQKYISFILLIVFIATFFFRDNFIIFNIHAMTFGLLIILLCSKFNFNNSILSFLGKHSFGIYIMQRFPMIVLSKFNLSNSTYIILTIISVSIIVFLFEKIVSFINKTMENFYENN